MFGTRTQPPASQSSNEPTLLNTPWIRNLINFSVVLIIIAVIIEVYSYAERRAAPLVKVGVERIEVRAELENPPPWLDRRILNQILNETNVFAVRDQATLDRLKDPLNQDVLRDLAANYTNADSAGSNHWTLRSNAWIKRITEIRRVINPARTLQTIQIFAEYRRPANWVERDGKYYLLDTDGVRLPEEYSAQDRKSVPSLMAITGLDLPGNAIPKPSESWKTDDYEAGAKLATLLATQPFAQQIAAIDMTNFRGRKDPAKAWITLKTIFSAGHIEEVAGQDLPVGAGPRIVMWGRPIGEEKYYDVSADIKLKTLNSLFFRYNRIDANRDFVDIHTEEVWIPQPPALADNPSGHS